jgi:hypothetical protein
MIVRRIAKAAAERRETGPGAESRAVSSFLRGLTTGALIGAAIAGSALLEWRRRRASTATRLSDAAGPAHTSRDDGSEP